VRKDLFKGVVHWRSHCVHCRRRDGGDRRDRRQRGRHDLPQQVDGELEPINTTSGHHCPTGTQTIVFYTKDQVDSLISSVTPTHHTVTYYEDESTGTQILGSGAGSNDVTNDYLLYDSQGLTGTPIAKDDGVFVHVSNGFAFLATLTFSFSNRSIEAMGSWPDGDNGTFAIMGGTDAYKGATGQVAFGTQVGNALPVNFDYTLPA